MRTNKYLMDEMDYIAINVFYGRVNQATIDLAILLTRAFMPVFSGRFHLIKAVAGWNPEELRSRHDNIVRWLLGDYFDDRRNAEIANPYAIMEAIL